MIVQEKAFIKIIAANIRYWTDRNYKVSLGQTLEVSVHELPSKSNVRVKCVCDTCGINYETRWGRNKEVCGRCRTTASKFNNNYGSANRKHEIPDKDELLSYLKNGKACASKHYGVSIPTINGWMELHEIELPKYYGSLRNMPESFAGDAKTLSMVECIRKYDAAASVIHRWCKELNIASPYTIKNYWDRNNQIARDNLELIKEMNKVHTLNHISDHLDLSIEYIKKVLREDGHNTILHSYNKSRGELEVSEYIKSLGFDCKSVKLDMNGDKRELDIYVEDKKFALEYCGEYFHSSDLKDKHYHQAKTLWCIDNDIHLMTIFDHEWKNDQPLMKSMIKSRLGLNQSIYARKCESKEISPSAARKFHEENHIAGYINSSINKGLFFNDELVSVLSLSKSRYDKNYELEITRYSTKIEYTIVGGASKLLSEFNDISIITYADLRFGSGKVYEQCGFEKISITSPGYWYFKKNGGYELESRVKYQKHKLKDFPQYSDDKTEHEIMAESGYLRIYDCGNVKYVRGKSN